VFDDLLNKLKAKPEEKKPAEKPKAEEKPKSTDEAPTFKEKPKDQVCFCFILNLSLFFF
jgi:hypothetical protein